MVRSGTNPTTAGARVFLGREQELAELGRTLDDAIGGRGRLVLVSGEPGIGKTRLADEFARRASPGALVLWGRCWEGGGAPAYWPWVRMIRSYARQADDRTLAAQLGSTAPYVAEIVPELRERLPKVPAPPKIEAEDSRFALFDAMAEFLASISRATALVLVFDDLHAADRPSLLMMRFIARELREARLLLLGIYRDVEARLSPEASVLLGEIAREGTQLSLRGFTPAEVARFIESAAAVSPSPSLVDTVHQATDGNPLFVEEVVRLLASEGRLEADRVTATSLTIPERVREAIRRRLDLLSADSRRILEIAAVVGRDFDLSMLQTIAGLPAERLEPVLRDAVRAGILAPGGGALGRSSFAHALFRESLYEGIVRAERSRVHHEVGEALEKMYAADLEPHLAELAHHFSQGPPSDRERAVEYATRAGDRGMAMLAYEEAVEQYDRALEILRLDRHDERNFAELLLRAGEARRRAGDRKGAREIFLQVAEVGRNLGSSAILARAALGYGAGSAVHAFFYRPRQALIELLEEVLRKSRSGVEDGLRVRLLARLAAELYWTNQSARVDALTQEALEIAERLADPRAKLVAIHARCEALWGPDTIDAALVSADEIVRLAEEVGDREMAYLGREMRLRALLQLGDRQAADLEETRCADLAEELRIESYRRHVRARKAVRAMWDGRIAEALSTVEKAFVSLFIGWVAGRFEEITAAGQFALERYPLEAGWRASYAATYAELGRLAEARSEFERFVNAGLSSIPRNDVWLTTMSMLARACALLQDVETARTLHALLSPYANQHQSLVATGGFGSVAGAVAQLEATLGRWPDAARRFEDAMKRNAAMGQKPLVAIVLKDYAAALVRRGGTGDGEKALALIDQALETMRAFGMDGWVPRVEALRREAEALARAPERKVELRKGDRSWTLSSEGRTYELKDAKGLAYLVCLLRHPYRDFHVVDLASGETTALDTVSDETAAAEGLRVTRTDHGDEILDREAKAAYRKRIGELQSELEEARHWNDPSRVATVEHEIEAITRELEKSIGFRGRTRRSATAAERARVNVTKSIRSAIERIGHASPALGAHLSAAVRTGIVCSYFPDPGSLISWWV